MVEYYSTLTSLQVPAWKLKPGESSRMRESPPDTWEHRKAVLTAQGKEYRNSSTRPLTPPAQQVLESLEAILVYEVSTLKTQVTSATNASIQLGYLFCSISRPRGI